MELHANLPAERRDPERANGADHADLVHAVRDYAAGRLDAGRLEAQGHLDGTLLGELREMGLFALSLPERYGGLGLGLAGAGAVITELARWDRSVATTVGLHAGLGTRGLVELGCDALKERWLPSLASGDTIASFAATEAGAGSDLGRVRTSVSEADGGGWLVDGEKCYVTNGAHAGLYTVLAAARAPSGRRGHRLVCVPRDAAGVSIGAEEDKLGLRASSTVTVTFDQVHIAEDHALGVAGGGLSDAQLVLSWGRTLMSAGCIGTAHAALERTQDHVRSRQQFGRPLIDNELVRVQVDEMAATVLTMEAVVDTVYRAEACRAPLLETSSFAKWIASEGSHAVCDQAVQLHGAMGYMESSGVPRLLRDCRVTRIFEGANDVLALHVALGWMGTREQARAIADAAVVGPFGAEIDAVEQGLAASKARLSARHGVGIIKAQTSLRAVADVLAALHCVREVCLRHDVANERIAARAVRMGLTRASAALSAIDRAESDRS